MKNLFVRFSSISGSRSTITNGAEVLHLDEPSKFFALPPVHTLVEMNLIIIILPIPVTAMIGETKMVMCEN